MSWKPDIPSREKVEAAFPRDVFNGAVEALEDVFWISLPKDQQDALLPRAGETEEQLAELVLVWNRLGDDRIQQIEALREQNDLAEKLGLSNYTLGTGDHPEIEAVSRLEREAEIALWLDYKSLFVFGDILVAGYVRLSEVIWQAPGSVAHREGTSAFLRSVDKARVDPGLSPPFAEYMDVLYDRLLAIDNLLGFYRDKFITHLPQDMLMVSSGGSLSVPLDFHVDHGQRREVTEAELRRLRKAVRQVEHAEGLNLGNDEPDPRPKLQALGRKLGDFRYKASVETIKRLLKEWGASSPPALTVAHSLNELLELWARTVVEKVGLVDPDADRPDWA